MRLKTTSIMSESGTEQSNLPTANGSDDMQVDVQVDSTSTEISASQNGIITNGNESDNLILPVRESDGDGLNSSVEVDAATQTVPQVPATVNSGAGDSTTLPTLSNELASVSNTTETEILSQVPSSSQTQTDLLTGPTSVISDTKPISCGTSASSAVFESDTKEGLVDSSRLLILYDQPKFKPIKQQVETFQSLGPMDTLEIGEFSNFERSDLKHKSYQYMNISIEYNDEFESNLRKVNEFINQHKDFVSRVQNIGYHIHFDGKKKWSEYSEFEKKEYSNLIDTLSIYKAKVYHVSIINKYEIDTIYLTEKNDLTKLGEDIQNDFKNWENLKTFDYSDNCIRFFPGVIFPDSLEVMNISGSYCIETLNGFKMPNNLKALIAGHNSINSIDNLKLPNKLETLNLADNKIYFLNYSEFPDTLKHLNLSNNRIDNIRGIEFPKNLDSLSLAFNPIDNIKGAKFPEKLKYLDISCIPNESMTGLKFPDSLTTLNLQESMANTRGLKLPSFLTHLNLGSNGVNSISPLKLPNTLTTLYLGNNNIKTLNKVQFPSNLTKLYLGNNLITTLKNVTFPVSLEVLDVEMDPNLDENDKRISNLKDVVLPHTLKVLNLGYQNIKVMENFEFPINLQELNLSFNDLKLMKNVKFHDNLKKLNISGNQELIEIDQFILPGSLTELMIPSQLIPNLPGYIIERANNKDLIITKSLPF